MVTARQCPTEYESCTVTIGVRRLIGMRKSFRQTVWLRLPASTRRSLPPLYAPALINKGHSLCRLSESETESESACTVRVPIHTGAEISVVKSTSLKPEFSYESTKGINIKGISSSLLNFKHSTVMRCSAAARHMNGVNVSKMVVRPSVTIPAAYFQIIHAFGNGRQSYASEPIAKHTVRSTTDTTRTWCNHVIAITLSCLVVAKRAETTLRRL